MKMMSKLMQLKEARQLLIHALKEVEHKKDVELFHFWYDGLLQERKLLCESFQESSYKKVLLWSVVLERIGEIDRMLDPRWIRINYMFYKQIMKHARHLPYCFPRSIRLRQATPVYFLPYWGTYNSRERKWNSEPR